MDYGDSLIPLRDMTGLVTQPAGAGANQLSTAISSSKTEWKYAYRMTITVSVSGAAKFGVVITPSGGSAQSVAYFNGGAPLAANALYTFTMAARPTDNYQFQVDTNAVSITNFYVEAVCGGI
jgi:hypothetical protein